MNALETTGASLPQFAKDEFHALLECGILAHGRRAGVCRSIRANLRAVAGAAAQEHYAADEDADPLRCVRRRGGGWGIALPGRRRSIGFSNGIFRIRWDRLSRLGLIRFGVRFTLLSEMSGTPLCEHGALAPRAGEPVPVGPVTYRLKNLFCSAPHWLHRPMCRR